jgi:CheY-like chemotaxis protein
VLDDNRDAADTLAMMLELLGHDVRRLYDPFEALEEVERFDPDLVFLDIGMPNLSGYELARRLRAQPRGDERVLVAVTGWGQPDDRRRTRRQGFDHHLVKPPDLDIVREICNDTTPGWPDAKRRQRQTLVRPARARPARAAHLVQTAAYLLRTDPGGDNAKELADIVVRQAQRMGRMIEELDDWGRAQQKRLVDRSERVDVEAALDMAIASQHGLAIESDIADDARGVHRPGRRRAHDADVPHAVAACRLARCGECARPRRTQRRAGASGVLR